MNTSTQATDVRFDSDQMWVSLADGRTLGVPLAWFPRLQQAPAEALAQVRISSRGLHWEHLNEDISIAGLLSGFGDQTRPHPISAA